MSDDSQNMERSTLERKDRAELAAVAGALGLKVPSRAKKADIVSLILDVIAQPGEGDAAQARSVNSQPSLLDPSAGSVPDGDAAVDSGSAEAAAVEEPASDAAAEAGDAPSADAAADVAPTRSDRQSRGEQNRAEQNRSGRSNNDQNKSDQNRSEQNKSDQNRSEQNRSEQNRSEQSRQDKAQAEQNRQEHQSGNAQSGNGQGGNGQPDGNQADPGHNDPDGDGDGEGGGRNRRRRRRGRDRVEGESGTGSEFEGEPVEVSGLLDLREDGYGFLRVAGFLPSRDDVYVSVKQCRQLGLRKGDHLTGLARPAGHKEKNPALTRVETVNGMDPEQARNRPRFDDLTPLFSEEKLPLEGGSDPADLTGRIIDLVAPIGKGQRGLIVSPPKAGRTTILKAIATAIEKNHPDVHLIVLLIDERPEEVTDFRRSLESGEVVASTFDRPAEEHTAVAELTIEHAKRLVEYGHDVVIVLDGITRLARAYNLVAPAGGRTLEGGLDAGAVYPTKRFFGAARNVEEGGSLTIVATAAVDSGSGVDAAILDELRGTANMELRLDRDAAERRIVPAISLAESSTLRGDLSGAVADGRSLGGLDELIGRLAQFSTNEAFLAEISAAPGA